MATKFNRRYELAIGNDFVLSDVRCRFTVEYFIGGFIPLMQMELYNISRNTAERLLVKGTPFRFSAGYDGDIGVMFIGEVRNVFVERDDVDIITTVLSGGSDKKLRETFVNISYSDTTNIVDLLHDHASAASLAVGEIAVTAKPIKGAVVKSGYFVDIAAQLAKEYNFVWYVHNDQFYAYDENIYAGREIYNISSATGLLDTPILTEQGFDIRTLMETSIRPQDRFKVSSKGVIIDQKALSFSAARTNVIGVQRAIQVKHTGDTHSNTWYTELRGQRVSDADDRAA